MADFVGQLGHFVIPVVILVVVLLLGLLPLPVLSEEQLDCY